MRKVRLGRTNLEVTKWGLGGIPLSTMMGGSDEETIGKVIDAALDLGINYIDTASIYMDSQPNIGKVMERRRSECILATKTLSKDKAGALEDVKSSLEDLRTDKIEIYQIHDLLPRDVATVMGPGGAVEGLMKAKADGLIGHIGLTSHHVSVLIDLIKTDVFDTVMFPFNVIEREPEKQLLAMAKEADVGTIVMKPIAGGAIANIEKAFRFFNAYPVDLILNGVANLKELRGNVQCAEDERPLTPAELADFEKEVAPLGVDFCRRCSYCMPCTNDIIIPAMIHVMYQATRGKRIDEIPPERREQGTALRIWLEACEECGKCEERCPYKIPTIERKNALLNYFFG